MGGTLIFLGLIIVAFILFVIYVMYKQIQFVLVAANLYRKMVRRQDAMIRLLLDIRDNTKQFVITPGQEESQEESEESIEPVTTQGSEEGAQLDFCYHCGAALESSAEPSVAIRSCPKCGKAL